MIVLGVALAVVALVIVAFVGVGGGEDVTVSAFGVDVTASSFVVFLAGAATLLVLLVGLWMVRWGVRRYERTKAEIQRLRRIEAEVEARQIAELSRDSAPPPTRQIDERRPGDPAPAHHSSPSPQPSPQPIGPREDESRQDPSVDDRTREMPPFAREAGPSGSTAADASRPVDQDDERDTVVVGDADGDRDKRRP